MWCLFNIIVRIVELSKQKELVPNYTSWAPWIGNPSRNSDYVYNTEYKKCSSNTDGELQEPIPEELLFHLLIDEKVCLSFVLIDEKVYLSFVLIDEKVCLSFVLFMGHAVNVSNEN